MDLALKIAAVAVLSAAAFLDIRHRKIPNWTVIALLALGVVRAIFCQNLLEGAIGLVCPAAVLLLLRVSRLNFVGLGDVKLTMAMGCFYGYVHASIMLLAALTMLLVCSLIVKVSNQKTDKSVPFAPFLCVVSLLGFFL